MEAGAGIALAGWVAAITGVVWDLSVPSDANVTAPVTVFVTGTAAAIGGALLVLTSGPKRHHLADATPANGRRAARVPAIRWLGLGAQETAARTLVPTLAFQLR
jgi:hypothetical protein